MVAKMKEEKKATQSEIKENIQGTNSEEKETGTQINDLEQRNIQPEQNEEIRIQKMRRGLETSGTSESLGCQKEKRKSNKLKT